MAKIYVSIWSNDKAEEMAKFYKSIFKGAKIGKSAYWPSDNPMGVQGGSVLTTHITIFGQKIMLLNGYMEQSFNESISLVVPCKTQREIDTYWNRLISGGGREAQCGWCIDKYGVRWQIAPADFDKWNTSKNTKKRDAVMHAMWKMVKLDIKTLKQAYDRA